MGFLLDKSKSDEFRKFFSQAESFEKGLNQYKIAEGDFVKAHTNFVFTENNIGGLPLAWNQEEGTVAVDQTDSHSLIIGPTGSKKTRLIAMPTVRIMGSAGESVIISDPKAEIYARTAEYMKSLDYDISVINLRTPDYSKRWNPLNIPYHFYCRGDMDKACEFANDIAQNMIPSINQKDPFWDNSAASFLFGLIMLLFKYCHDYDMPENQVNLKNIFELRNVLFTGIDAKTSFLWEYARKDAFIRKRWNWRAYEFSIDYMLAGLEYSLDFYDERMEEILKLAKEYKDKSENKEYADRAYRELANVYLGDDNQIEGEKILREAVENIKKAPSCALQLADFYYKRGLYEEAADYIKQCILMNNDLEPSVNMGYPYILYALCLIRGVYDNVEKRGSEDKELNKNQIKEIEQRYKSAKLCFGGKEEKVMNLKRQIDLLKEWIQDDSSDMDGYEE